MFTRGIPDGLSSMQRFQWKRDLVIDWLVTARFSSLEILSALTGMKSKDNAYFFKRLIETGVIVRFKNETHSKKDLVRLGRAGWGLYCGGELPDTNIRSDVFEKHQRIAHDLQVQKLMLNRFVKFSEIHISYDQRHEDLQEVKPDALVFDKSCNGKPACIEVEYTRKNHQKIYEKFHQYRKKITDGSFSWAVFYFMNESDCETYKRLFEAESWPKWSKKKNNKGKEFWSRDEHNMPVNSNESFRSHFLFVVLNNPTDITLNASKVFETPEESQLEKWYDRKERERWEEKKEAERLAATEADERQGAVLATEQDEPEDDGNDAMDFSKAFPKPHEPEQTPAKKGFWAKMLS